jgi:hypothetical protein
MWEHQNVPYFIPGDKRSQSENDQVRGHYIEYMNLFGPVFHIARDPAKAALSAQNISLKNYAIKVT